MLTKILLLIGLILLATFIIMVACGNKNGEGFLLPSLVILGLSGLSHDLAHPRPKRPQETADRPRKRRRVQVEDY